jgi:hypothetical protein
METSTRIIDYSFVLQLKVNLHPFSSRETFSRPALLVDFLLAEFNLLAQIVVGTVWVMMKETKAINIRFDG